MPENEQSDPLSLFSAPIRAWFEAAFGRPTPPQELGWPAIRRGEHTLILAPTGSGKTFAAFLSGIDQLYRELTGDDGRDADPNLKIRKSRRAATGRAYRIRVAPQGAEQRHLPQPAAAAGVHP